MMTNKVLIKLYIPCYDISYDLFIPVNEVVWKVVDLISKSCNELSGILMNNCQFVLVNKISNQIYSLNSTIYETDIRNGTELVLQLLNK